MVTEAAKKKKKTNKSREKIGQNPLCISIKYFSEKMCRLGIYYTRDLLVCEIKIIFDLAPEEGVFEGE